MHTRLVSLGATALTLCACSAMNPDTPASTTKPAAPANPREADAVSALVSLGYKPSDAQHAVTAAGKSLGAEAKVEELVRAALRSA